MHNMSRQIYFFRSSNLYQKIGVRKWKCVGWANRTLLVNYQECISLLYECCLT